MSKVHILARKDSGTGSAVSPMQTRCKKPVELLGHGDIRTATTRTSRCTSTILVKITPGLEGVTCHHCRWGMGK